VSDQQRDRGDPVEAAADDFRRAVASVVERMGDTPAARRIAGATAAMYRALDQQRDRDRAMLAIVRAVARGEVSEATIAAAHSLIGDQTGEG